MSLNFKKALLLVGDLLFLYLSLWLTLLVRYQVWPSLERWQQHFEPFTTVYVAWIVVFYIAGLYSIAVTRNDVKFFTSLFKSMLVNAGLAAVFFYLTPFVSISPKTNFVINIILATALIMLWRQMINIFLGAKNSRLRALLIGEQEQLGQLQDFLQARPQLGYKISKTISPASIVSDPGFDLKKLVEENGIKVVAVESAALRGQALADQLFKILPLKIKVLDLASFSEEVSGKIPVKAIGQAWFLDNLNLGGQMAYEKAKRLFDFVLAALSLLILIWLMPVIALSIRLTMGRPVIFKQTRLGLLGGAFTAMKFRSMIRDAETAGPQWAQKNDPRVTPLGRVLRQTRLDEIPQLVNVLRGEMSFVGPRPERPEFVSLLRQKIPFYNERHLVKPGLTGWAQINFPYGASETDALEKLQYDLYYVKNRSLVFDLAIILKTIKTILSLSGSEGKKWSPTDKPVIPH